MKIGENHNNCCNQQRQEHISPNLSAKYKICKKF